MFWISNAVIARDPLEIPYETFPYEIHVSKLNGLFPMTISISGKNHILSFESIIDASRYLCLSGIEPDISPYVYCVFDTRIRAITGGVPSYHIDNYQPDNTINWSREGF